VRNQRIFTSLEVSNLKELASLDVYNQRFLTCLEMHNLEVLTSFEVCDKTRRFSPA
jgi:hypothetical protein